MLLRLDTMLELRYDRQCIVAGTGPDPVDDSFGIGYHTLSLRFYQLDQLVTHTPTLSTSSIHFPVSVNATIMRW